MQTLIGEKAFYDARYLVMGELATRIRGAGGIGTQSEKMLHSILKYAIEPDEEKHEIKLLGSVVDIFRDGEIYEIQTRSFHKLRPKLDKLLPHYKLHLIYPIAKSKILHWVTPETGEISEGKRSPKKGSPLDAIFELSSIRSYLTHENLKVHLLLLHMEEYRYLNGYGKDKKRHATRMERIPLSLAEEITLSTPQEYLATFLPPSLVGIPFTQKQYESATRLKGRYAYSALHFLIDQGTLAHIGNEGRAFVYQTV